MDAVGIVPGDVLVVRLGDIVPADIKIMGDENAEEEEAPMQVGYMHDNMGATQQLDHAACATLALVGITPYLHPFFKHV